VRQNREKLKGGSSVWQCNERLQVDIAARKFRVAVQRDSEVWYKNPFAAVIYQ